MVPKVFISSTQADLKEFRQAAKDAALKTGCMPVMFEHWVASGERPPVSACLAAVSDCDLVLVIAGHRYGWVPPDQSDGRHHSVTRMECEQAMAEGKEIIALLVDEQAPWPADSYEEYEATRALRKGLPTAAELTAIRRSVEELANFKTWLRSRAVSATFQTPADLRGEAIAALNDWRNRHTGKPAGSPSASDRGDPTRLLWSLLEHTKNIDIRGLQTGSGRAHSFPIEDLYIPLSLKGESGSTRPAAESQNSELQLLLKKSRVVVIGDPGSGKTTMLRRIGFALAGACLAISPEQAASELGIEGEPPLPLLIRCSDFIQFVEARNSGQAAVPQTPDSSEWLIRYLAHTAAENSWALEAEFFAARLKETGAMILLDGLDEAPSVESRQLLSRLIENCAHDFERSQIVVTSRPKAYAAEVVLRSFERVDVEPLGPISIRAFLKRWCEALFANSPAVGVSHYNELLEALDSRAEIRKMATNPVMLTALAVVHWNDRRIPDQRAELYESIITWLSRAREERAGRIPAHRCVRLLQSIALEMQNHAQGRLVEVPRRSAAEWIAASFSQHGETATDEAERFLAEEELDSGIIVSRGANLRFWHLSFQEFLAARALAAQREADQKRLLLAEKQKLLSAEWRETILLFAGILHAQGPEKAVAMLETILKDESAASTLTQQARIVGLVGPILRDLSGLQFRFEHPGFARMMTRVMTIFDPDGFSSVPYEVRLEAADALGQAGDPRLREGNWVLLSGGRFRIGSQADKPLAPGYDPWSLPSEGPPAERRMEAFEINRFPVTVEEYGKFVADGGYEQPSLWPAGGYETWKRPEQWDVQLQYPNRPVVGVSWYEAMAYCRWRGEGVRLPYENEWERAAQGANRRSFPWGNERPSPLLLNFKNDEMAVGHATPVGFYPMGATPEGLLDMAGNVLEWCLDRRGEGTATQAEDAVGRARVGDHRAVRGGSFRSVRLLVRAVARGKYVVETRKEDLGFRICRSAASLG